MMPNHWRLDQATGSEGVTVQLERLAPSPLTRPPDWQRQVTAPMDARTLDRVHLSIAWGRPFGDDSSMARMAKRYGLESSLRDPRRPRKIVKKETSARYKV